MEILFCIMIFIMGTVFGSFFTLAVYRIPLGLNITHERSFCPNCNHKLSFKDLIPIFSYISLKGKCRYCGEKVRIRYLFLEVLSGIVFLVAYLSFNMNFPFFTVDRIIDFIAFVCFYITIVIISGIDKENIKIDKSVLLFGIITQTLYILYLYIMEDTSIYRYSIYLVLLLIMQIANILYFRKTGKNAYILEILVFSFYIIFATSAELFLLIAIITAILVAFNALVQKVKFNLKDKPDILKENEKKSTSIGYFLGIATILVVLAENVLKYCIK